MNIKNVLVPVDFSPPSRLAVNCAIAFARKFRSTLTLLHVIESEASLIAGCPAGSAEAAKHSEQATRMLSALIAPEDQDDSDLRVIIKSGDIADEIELAIAELRTDLIVMGTHGRGLFGRLMIGSVTQGLLRKIRVPILTVSRAVQPLAFKRILFATDCSQSSKSRFAFVLDLARVMQCEIVLLHVLEPVMVTYGGAEMAEYVSRHSAAEVRDQLSEFVVKGEQAGVTVEPLVAEGTAADEILRAAENNEADLLVITVEAKGFVERALLGTTAERVIREARVPVLSIPA